MLPWSSSTNLWEKRVKTVAGFRLCVFFVAICTTAAAQETSSVRYLANEGVMVVHGETKVLFDPIFHYDPDTYQRLPQRMREAIIAGEPPYDGVDGAFVSTLIIFMRAAYLCSCASATKFDFTHRPRQWQRCGR